MNNELESLEDEIKRQKGEKEYLDDVTMEMELVDEEDKVQYKIGDTFVFLPQPEVMERLEQDTGKINNEIDSMEEHITKIISRMDELKKELYAKFGNAINLER